MKIIVDAFGGDNSPQAVIDGAVAALNSEKDCNIVLVGDEKTVKKLLEGKSYDASRLSFLDASDVITNDESPAEAIRKKPESSIVKSLRLLGSDEDAAAFVSAGSTGAVLAGSVLLLKRLKGVARPALAPLLPTVKGGNVVLIDCGSNPDCKALNLVQFAYIGTAYAKTLGLSSTPRVGLLSNGAEDKKGNELCKEVFPLLKADKKINFLGNVEAREILSGDYDVIVSDGFSGNIALKSAEGTALSMFTLIKEGIMKGGLRAKLGYLLLKPVFKGVKKTMDYNDNGGAVLLGLVKVVVKIHGSSKANAVCAGILQAKHLVEGQTVEAVKNIVSEEADV